MNKDDIQNLMLKQAKYLDNNNSMSAADEIINIE